MDPALDTDYPLSDMTHQITRKDIGEGLIRWIEVHEIKHGV